MAATTEKTIHYALPMIGQNSNINTGTTYTDSADTTIYIPETTSRTFKNVTAEIHVHENATTLYAFAAAAARFSCDAGSTWTSLTKTVAIANSGENVEYVFFVDLTAEFTARFSGASDTLRWGFYLSLATNTASVSMYTQASCVVHITYEYDATAHSTQINSVLIPFESTTTATTASLAEIGTNQFPNLSTFLPEASVTVRQMAVVLDCDLVSASTTDCSGIALAFDSEGEVVFGTLECAARSDTHHRLVWIRNDLSTSGTHALKWRHAAGGVLQRGGGYFIVTYEFDASSSNDIMVSRQIVIGDDHINTTPLTGDNMVEDTDFWVPEPATVTLKQSAVYAIYMPQATTITNTYLAMGSQSYRTYALGSAQQSDYVTVMQRVDSGGVQGAGLTLSRGRNTITFKTYTATAARNSCFGGILFLNYTCAKPTGGSPAKSRTLWYCQDGNLDGGSAVDQNITVASPTWPSIIESNYWISNVGHILLAASTQLAYSGLALSVERQSGEGGAAGWRRMGAGVGITLNERSNIVDPLENTKYWKKYPNDPRYDRMDIETSRPLRYNLTIGCLAGVLLLVDLHNVTFTKSGTATGYADADGAGLTIEWFWENTENTTEKIGESTTAAGGTYSLTWYDDTVNIFASLREDATHVGRSERGTS
jgi:hypothetical protein